MQSLECLFIRSASPRLFFRLLCQAYSVHVTMFTFYHFSCVFNDDHVTMPTICQFMFTCINSRLHVSMLSVSFFFVIRFVMFFFFDKESFASSRVRGLCGICGLVVYQLQRYV